MIKNTSFLGHYTYRVLCMSVHTEFRHNLRHAKTFFQKNTQAEGVCNQHLPLALSTLSQQNSQTFGTKSLPRRRFVQHYYRDTFIESTESP